MNVLNKIRLKFAYKNMTWMPVRLYEKLAWWTTPFRVWFNPQTSATMWIWKKLINFAVIVAERFVPHRKATKLTTQMLDNVGRQLLEAVEDDRLRNPKRHHVNGKIVLEERDPNFTRLLHFCLSLVRFLAESDPFYQLWLGYFVKHSHLAYENGFQQLKEQLEREGEKHPKYTLTLTNPAFQLRAWNLKLCGGLHIYDEEKQKCGE